MNLISERGINQYLFPVINSKGKNIKYPYLCRQRNREVLINNSWPIKNFIIMDVLTTIVFRSIFGNDLPNVDHNLIQKKLSKVSDELINHLSLTHSINKNIQYSEDGTTCINNFILEKPITIQFTEKYLKIKFPFLKKIFFNEFYTSILNIEKSKFKLNYPVKVLKSKNNIERSKYSYFNNIDSSEYDSFFEIKNIDVIKKSKDGKVLDRQYIIEFSTILSFIYYHNIVTRNIDILRSELFELKPLTHMIYRHMILPHKSESLIMYLNTIKERLDLNNNTNDSQLKSNISKSLDELLNNDFLKSWSVEKNYTDYLFRIGKLESTKISKK